MFIKMTDSDSGKVWYVNVDRLVLIEKVDPDYLVTFQAERPVLTPGPELRTVRLAGAEASALLAYLEANAWKGGGR
jgi:hypothetical protein